MPREPWLRMFGAFKYSRNLVILNHVHLHDMAMDGVAPRDFRNCHGRLHQVVRLGAARRNAAGILPGEGFETRLAQPNDDQLEALRESTFAQDERQRLALLERATDVLRLLEEHRAGLSDASDADARARLGTKIEQGDRELSEIVGKLGIPEVGDIGKLEAAVADQLAKDHSVDLAGVKKLVKTHIEMTRWLKSEDAWMLTGMISRKESILNKLDPRDRRARDLVASDVKGYWDALKVSPFLAAGALIDAGRPDLETCTYLTSRVFTLLARQLPPLPAPQLPLPASAWTPRVAVAAYREAGTLWGERVLAPLLIATTKDARDNDAMERRLEETLRGVGAAIEDLTVLPARFAFQRIFATDQVPEAWPEGPQSPVDVRPPGRLHEEKWRRFSLQREWMEAWYAAAVSIEGPDANRDVAWSTRVLSEGPIAVFPLVYPTRNWALLGGFYVWYVEDTWWNEHVDALAVLAERAWDRAFNRSRSGRFQSTDNPTVWTSRDLPLVGDAGPMSDAALPFLSLPPQYPQDVTVWWGRLAPQASNTLAEGDLEEWRTRVRRFMGKNLAGEPMEPVRLARSELHPAEVPPATRLPHKLPDGRELHTLRVRGWVRRKDVS